MPSKKPSPTKAKKSPAKARSRSRTRSTSKSRKSVTRSRSRSASRRSVTEVKQKRTSSASPGRPPKVKSVTSEVGGSQTAQVVQKEETIVPTRVSRRIIERNSFQHLFSPPSKSLPPFTISPTNIIVDGGNCSDANNNAASKAAYIDSEVADKPTPQVTKSSVTDQGDLLKATTSSTTSLSKPASDGGLGYAGILMVPFLLALTYIMVLSCSKTSCSVLKLPQCPATWTAFLNLEVAAVTLVFHLVMILLTMVPVGVIVQGQPLRDGHRLSYQCNAWFSLLALAAAFGYALTQTSYPIKMSYVHDHTLQFATTHLILAFVCSLVIFIVYRDTPLAERTPAADGTFWNDFFMGRILNPRIGNFDLKQHIFRLPVIIWLLLDLMYLADRFKTNQLVDPALATVVLSHTLYIMFNLKNESTWFSSNDFMKEGVGFVYCWAAFCFMPYVGSLQARFLYLYPSEGVRNPYLLALLFMLNVVGLMFYIGSNWQKNEFRKNPYNPELAHLSSIPTATGKRILCSGWWGIVRRPNYFGDLLMAVTWSLICGVGYGVPYAYPLYLIILLVGRVIADEKSCHQRYGDAWIKYTETVRYRLIPFVF